MSKKNKDLEGQDKDNKDNQNEFGNWGDDDNFGLPDVDFEPLKRDEESEDEAETESPKMESEEVDSDEESTNEESTSSSDFNFDYSSINKDDEEDESTEDYDLDYPGDKENFHRDSHEESEKKSSKGLWTTIIVLVIIIGGVLGYMYYLKPMMDNKEYQEQIAIGDAKLGAGAFDEAITAFLHAKEVKPEETYPTEQIQKAEAAKEAAALKLAEEEAAKKAAEEEAARLAREAAEAAKKPKIGAIETVSGRTGRYYIIVASNIDEDLAMDYAQKLSKTGTNVKIIAASKQGAFHRVTVGDFDSYSEAQAKADELKATYSGSWVSKY